MTKRTGRHYHADVSKVLEMPPGKYLRLEYATELDTEQFRCKRRMAVIRGLDLIIHKPGHRIEVLS